MDIETYILTAYDADGNPIGIPAIQGRGIESIVRTVGDGSAGTTDIYTITYTDLSTSTFTVHNGADGRQYTLTDEDRAEIASEAAKHINTDGFVSAEQFDTLREAIDDKQIADFVVNVDFNNVSDKSWLDVYTAREEGRRVYLDRFGIRYEYIGEGYDYSDFEFRNGTDVNKAKLYDYHNNVVFNNYRLAEESELPKSDWDQNDETSKDYVRNRTHWSEFGGVTEIMPETNLVLVSDNGGDMGARVLGLAIMFDLTVGETYIINWNGTEYESEAFSYTENSISAVMLGNINIADPTLTDTGAPFVLVYAPDFVSSTFPGATAVVVTRDDSETATMSIVKRNEIVHPLDEKYIPDSIKDDINAVQEEVNSLSEAIADKATLENGVITFWKAAETEDGTDTELFTVDISSVGGSGGLDLNNLTLSVTQVGEYQRLSMSDGATTKTVDIPITAINDTQVKSAVYAYLDENPPSNTKKVTENDLRIYFGWKFALGDLSANTTSYSTYSSNAPFWMPAGTVLTKTINAKVEIFRYTGDTSTYANGFALAKNWTTAVGTTYEIPSDGWYVFLHWGYASSAVPAVYTAERTGVGGYAAIQKPAFTFEYTADVDFEPAYQFTVDWNCPGINISTTAVEKYTNGLYKACHRQPGYPCYMHTQTNGSIWGRYLVWADLTTTTHSAGYSSDLLSYKDELWIITTGSDTHDYLTNIMKIKVYENGWVERLGEIHTNLGHINAIRYDEETDTLTWGNGSGNYELEGEIYIINNFSNSPLVKDYASDIILWDDLVTNGWIESLSVPVADYGFKANFIGFCEPIRLDVNTGRRLTTVLLTNDGNTIRFGEITPTLNDDGSHTYSLTNLTWTKTQDIGDTTETQTASYNHCVQGMDAYNGRAIWGNGHSCVWLASYKIEPASLTTKPQISTTKINRQDMMLSALNARGIRGLAVQGDRLYLIQDGGILWYDAKVADRI